VINYGTNFSSSTSVRRPFCSKPPPIFAQTCFAQKLRFACHIFVAGN